MRNDEYNQDLTIKSDYLNEILDLEFLRIKYNLDEKVIKEEILFMFDLQNIVDSRYILDRIAHRDC